LLKKAAVAVEEGLSLFSRVSELVVATFSLGFTS
jgi:hypothetical protein